MILKVITYQNYLFISIKKKKKEKKERKKAGNSLVVQWLGLSAFIAGAWV